MAGGTSENRKIFFFKNLNNHQKSGNKFFFMKFGKLLDVLFKFL